MYKSLILFLLVAQFSQAGIQVWPLGIGARFEREDRKSVV